MPYALAVRQFNAEAVVEIVGGRGRGSKGNRTGGAGLSGAGFHSREDEFPGVGVVDGESLFGVVRHAVLLDDGNAGVGCEYGRADDQLVAG